MQRPVVLFGLLSLAPIAVMAQSQTYYHAGAWTAFSERDDKGGAVCGISNVSPADNRRLSIRFVIGGAETSFVASKPNWTIPAETHVPVVMQLGLNMPIAAKAGGTDQSMTWMLDQKAWPTFDTQFRTSPLLTVTFPDGNEPPWMLALTGSSAISETFARCVRDLTRQFQATKTPAAPAEPPAATQPFSEAGNH